MTTKDADRNVVVDILACQKKCKSEDALPALVDENDGMSSTTYSSFESIDPHMEIHVSKIFKAEEKQQQQDHGCAEYEAEIPITEHGLLLMLKNRNGAVTFDGYAKKPDGSQGPAEKNNLVRNLGDTVVAINGFVTLGLPFVDIFMLIRDIVHDDNHGGFMYFTFVDGFEYRNRQDKVNKLNSKSMDLNVAYEALENMRKANLEVQFADNVDCTQCTQCLRAYVKKEKEMKEVVLDGRRIRRFARRFRRVSDSPRKRKGSSRSPSPTSVMDDSHHDESRSKQRVLPKMQHKSCLVCCSPVCNAHSSETFRQGSILICTECSPLFSIDYIQESLVPKFIEDDEQRRKKCLYRMVEMYDRALLMLKFSAQYIDDVSNSLEISSKRNHALSSRASKTSLVSGITGVVAAATIFTPAGPPLLIASLFFGGSATAISTGSEAVTFHSEPNKLADKIIVIHALVKSLMRVTNVLHQAVVDPESFSDTDNVRDEGTAFRPPMNRIDEMEKYDPEWNDDSSMDEKEEGNKEGELMSTVARATAETATRLVKFAGDALHNSSTKTVEVNDINDTVQRISAGSPHDKAEILQSIKKEMKIIPETGIIADLCDQYMVQIASGPREI
mmetsp:Transcript_9854/g.15155  ORF Transcript_9854/g.15155 Transcript_9854/m.15155 type:complete len:615 (+) Transcript_9854:83-1927(+)